ncbi:hypothetical protein CSB45_02555 [candidate division KSB3 bacterium]|uniref:Tetratricopeptide repeat protein n=1 Tax=candidate division KSB3 bacterium TaxID=2044937 RepID=A0A2G6E9Z6_9BACT|nr:MAG: hypothetical protein CSB45_02555 [candidate division KSB3 bacterium]PIE30961.1 MAG: hypothetical protein CSA57_01170 [candidate division KSB3 bacterium]
MKKRDFIISPTRYALILGLFGILLLSYIARAVPPVIALLYHQQFSRISTSHAQRALHTLRRAVRFDPHNPQYHQTLATALHQLSAEQSSLEESQRMMQHAAASIRQAIMLNPGDPWNYYELGRLEDEQHNCFTLPPEACPAQQYFLYALQKYPGSLFLRGVVASWLYPHDPAHALELIQSFLRRSPESTSPIFDLIWERYPDYETLKRFLPDTPKAIHEFSKFLYQHHLDYASDLEMQRAASPASCDAADVLQRSPDRRVLVLGHDDGSADWRSYLASEDTRIKKTLCLPDDVASYDEAVLQILMNRGVPGDCITDIYVNKELIQPLTHSIPHEPAWNEIPIDISLLHGKRAIHVYVRVRNASASGNYLQIMGDHDTPTARSVFNLDATRDLSLDNGIQQGEYMIRLVLKKH